MTSLTWSTPSSAATRGIRSLPKVVDGPSTCVYPAASFATCGAWTAASGSALAAFSATSTFPTRVRAAACAATDEPSAASTSTSIAASGTCAAQVTHFAVLGFSREPSCSATTRILLITPTPSS
jgi:hypothetical protein